MIQIKHRFTDAVLCEFDVETTKQALELAVKSGADLSGADLSGAYLSGANLSGADLRDANLSGEKLSIAPISILNLTWDILISGDYLKIGCKRHTHEAWANFSDDEIASMESRASEFWRINKSWILELCKTHKEQAMKARAE